jgi:protein-tyrosine-phosphatase
LYGNICRSPIGERYLRNYYLKKIDSAGTGALVDHAADESAIKIAESMAFLRDIKDAIYIISWSSI